uniref:CD209 antigen-like protein C n=1 Tax=Euleptes europaea TaxID=460621 RepID=UPI0025412F25|nr:CD209 antigen-like protein C [Euleptes europaea]
MAPGNIYMQCEEPEIKNNMLDRTSRKSGGFLLQSCRCCSEGTSISILYIANAVLFLLWIITTIVISGKHSETAKELEQLHGSQTLLSSNDTQMEKKLGILQSNQSAYASQMNNNLQKWNDSQTKQIQNVTNKLGDLQSENEKIWNELLKVVSVLHKLNASACKMCPEGWLMHRGQCYYFHEQSMHWSLAKTFCENQGGYLVSINDNSEQMFLQSNKKNINYWIGLNDIKSENNFVWVDGSRLTYSHWSLFQPDDYDSGEDCGTMKYSGYWNDYGCGNTLEGCICEMSWDCQ